MTALARYVFQCKNGNMNIRGQICYGLYILCHLITRSCMAIAMFSTAESSGKWFVQNSCHYGSNNLQFYLQFYILPM